MALKIINRATHILRNEGLYSLLYSTKWYLRNLLEIPPTRLRHLSYDVWYGKCSPEPYEILYIDPHDVEYVLLPSFRDDIITRGTHIKRGDWDVQITDEVLSTTQEVLSRYGERRLVRFSNYGLYRAIEDHIVNQKPWTDTSYYAVKIEQGVSEEELECERRETVKLYHKIKEEGYKLQEELSEVEKEKGPPEYDEIRINIGRNGQLILDDCRHRLSIARILDLETVPVRILVRHAKWQKIRNKVTSVQKMSNLDGDRPPLFSHPDLENISTVDHYG